MVLALAACSDSSGPANPRTIELRPPTTGAAFAGANGTASFENEGGERELEIQIEDVPPGTALVFFFDNAQIATQTADVNGSARINLNSDAGATVPTSVAGKVVSVRTAAGVVVVTGTF
jgi:hypothetical protein